MNFEELKKQNPGKYLLGRISAFESRHQAGVDAFYKNKDITWKQFFAVTCIRLCEGDPTISELSEIMGSSHQNVKQLLLKLEKRGFVELTADPEDRRKQRIRLTRACRNFCKTNASTSDDLRSEIFEGISNKSIMETIKVIDRMEENLKKMEARRG